MIVHAVAMLCGVNLVATGFAAAVHFQTSFELLRTMEKNPASVARMDLARYSFLDAIYIVFFVKIMK